MRTLLFLLLVCTGSGSFAQSYTVVADSLRLPNGLEIDAQGRMWITESGYGFDDGAVSLLTPDGDVWPVVVGLPAFFDTVSMESVGPWHTLALPDNKLAVFSPINGGVLIFDLNGWTPGVSAPLTAAGAVSSVIISDFVYQNQPPEMPDSNPYTGVVDAAGNWYIADAGFNGIIKVDATGQRSVFCTFDPIPNPTPVGPPFIDAVPTRILLKPGGGFYVCNLTGFPFLEGSASIFEVSAAGVVSPFAGGFTMLTDLIHKPGSGDIYALQVGTFDLSVFNFAPNSAKVTRLRANGTRETVAENFDLSPGMAIDAAGNLFVSELATGRVLRFNGAATGVEEENESVAGVNIAPNPAVDQAQVQYHLPEKATVTLRLLDAGGKLLRQESLGIQEAGIHIYDWSRHSEPAGVYWLDLQCGNSLQTQRLILR